MTLGWSDIAFRPDDTVLVDTAAAWRWLIPEPWRLLVCSMFGGLFFEKASGGAFWLECGTGLIEQVAESGAAFDAFMQSERSADWQAKIDDWFLTPFVADLHAAGKRPGPGQCYGLTILPVFEGGTYSVGNVFVTSAREWLTVTGDLHRQLSEMPDGSEVTLVIKP